MKRVRAFLITGTFLVLLYYYAGYNANIQEIVLPNIPQEKEEQTEDGIAKTTETDQHAVTIMEPSPDNSEAVTEETTGSVIPQTPVQTNQPTSKVKDYGTYDSVDFDEIEEIQPTVVDKITTEVISSSFHNTVGEEAYYQYTALNDTERDIYRMIVEAIKSTQNVVELRRYACSGDTIAKVYEYVVADYPQFFYLAKSYYYTYIGGSRNVNQLILRYSDGVTEDQFDNRGNLTTRANRDSISQQIYMFNEKIADIVRDIPTNATDIQKEKQNYDYLQANIVYDKDAAQLATGSYTGIVPHSYDAYGAACEGIAVCEGYAELFQYLCYCVGINATQVYGTAMGGAHMWNAVCLGNEWYMLDVTWDDSGNEGLRCYQYFNLTTSQMEKDHTVSPANIRVPDCNSTAYAFYNHYAMRVENEATAPVNYSSVLDYLTSSTEQYLCLYIGNQALDVGKYISRQLLGRTSDVQRYIRTKNYSIALSNSYYQIGNYCYIPLK